MGAKLMAYYDQAANLGGLKAKMRLAVLTGISSATAASVEDSADSVKKFENALSEIKKEFGK